MPSNAKNLIKQYYDAFNHQDVKLFLNCLDENVVHDINHAHQELGKAKFQIFLERMNRCYKEIAKDILIMVNDEGTRAAAEFIIEGSYIATDSPLPDAKGQQYALRCGAFFEIKNDKIMRVTNYYNLNEWLKQIGN